MFYPALYSISQIESVLRGLSALRGYPSTLPCLWASQWVSSGRLWQEIRGRPGSGQGLLHRYSEEEVTSGALRSSMRHPCSRIISAAPGPVPLRVVWHPLRHPHDNIQMSRILSDRVSSRINPPQS